MGRIIQFPINETKIQSILGEKIESGLNNFPKDIAACLKKSFTDLSSLRIVKKKSFDLTIPNNISDDDLLKLKEEVGQIIKSYEKDLLPVLMMLAEKDAELCMLKYKSNP